MKPCSCGVPKCPHLGPAGVHDWDPLSEPVDDCGLCGGKLDVLPYTHHARRQGEHPEAGPPMRPVRIAAGYAHGECA